MSNWKFSIGMAILSTAFIVLISGPFFNAIGIASLIFIYLISPLLGFCSALLVAHRKGWLWLYPVALTIIYTLAILAIIGSFSPIDIELTLLIAGFMLFPSLLATAIGGLAHQKKWLSHPILLPSICFVIFLIAIIVNKDYANSFLNTQSPLLLYGYLSAVFAIMGILLGVFDKKGYLTPMALGIFFQLVYGFMNANYTSHYIIIYLGVCYLCLFLSRYVKNTWIKPS